MSRLDWRDGAGVVVGRSALYVVDLDRTIQYTWQTENDGDTPDLAAVNRATDCHDDRCELPEDKSYLFS